MDSNHDKGLQRALCYRYTTGQTAKHRSQHRAACKEKIWRHNPPRAHLALPPTPSPPRALGLFSLSSRPVLRSSGAPRASSRPVPTATAEGGRRREERRSFFFWMAPRGGREKKAPPSLGMAGEKTTLSRGSLLRPGHAASKLTSLSTSVRLSPWPKPLCTPLVLTTIFFIVRISFFVMRVVVAQGWKSQNSASVLHGCRALTPTPTLYLTPGFRP